jgi:hypothetical protein
VPSRDLRPEEKWARSVLERELGCPVEQHDDGSRDRMYDLRVVYEDGTTGAVEVTAAADAETIEFWNLMNTSGRWVVPDLVGRWSVHVEPSAQVRKLRTELPALLMDFENAGRLSYETRRRDFDATAAELGVITARQSGTDSPGSIYVWPELPPDRVSAFVGDTGDPLAEWLGTFLSKPEQADVRMKLATSKADETHAFVVVPAFTPAPFTVVDVLIRGDVSIPTFDPVLPDEISHVWAASSWATGAGFGWSRDKGWFTFDKVVDEDPSKSA